MVFFKGNVGIGPKVGPRLNFIGKHKNVWVFENISRLLTAEHLQRTWENPYGTIPTQTHMRASQETQKKADRWIPPKNILMANKHLLSKTPNPNITNNKFRKQIPLPFEPFIHWTSPIPTIFPGTGGRWNPNSRDHTSVIQGNCWWQPGIPRPTTGWIYKNIAKNGKILQVTISTGSLDFWIINSMSRLL